MATPQRGPLAGGALARPAARAAQGRPPPRTDRRQALSVDRVQGEGRLDAGARIFARGAQLRGYRTRQVTSASAIVCRSFHVAHRTQERLYSAGAGGASGASGGALVAGPRSGRSSLSSTAPSAAIKKTSAPTNANRKTAARPLPPAPAGPTTTPHA